MQAGVRIELLPGFSTTPRIERFVAEIVPCPDQRLANPNVDQTDNAPYFSTTIDEQFEKDAISDLRIIPNPNSGTFTITGTDMQRIQLLETSGKIVRQMRGPFANAVQVSDLSNGLYIVRVQMTNGSVGNKKVIIN